MLTYNQEPYIDEAIRSVMLQKTSFHVELVIGNDASTDRTTARCEAWREKYPDRIILLNRIENLGLQHNFIQSYAHCRGEYVAICEGDDFWCDSRKLQRQVDFLDAHPDFSCCFHRVINYYIDRGTKSLSNGEKCPATTTLLDLARSNYISNVSSVFRRNLFGPLPDWFAHVSTYDYAIHMLNAEYGKIHYMKRPMAVYRQHGKAIWSEARTDKKLDIALNVRELLIDHFYPNYPEVYDALRMAHSSICLNLIDYYQSEGNEEGVAQTRLRLMQYRPELTLGEVISLESKHTVTGTDKVKRHLMNGLKKSRAFVSLFVPVPRIVGEC